MLQGLREVNGQAVPYERMFYGQPSTIREDEHNVVHSIHQGEGGEQGPLGSIGRCRQFRGFCAREKSCSHFWMTCTSCALPRELSKFMAFCRRSCGDMQESRMGEIPRSGTKQACILQDVNCWNKLPGFGQVLGCPLNSKECAFWELRWSTQISCLRSWRRSPEITFCFPESREARANYLLRVVRPGLVREFAERHDSSLWTCMCEILRVDPGECSANALRWEVLVSEVRFAQVVLRVGRVGLMHWP